MTKFRCSQSARPGAMPLRNLLKVYARYSFIANPFKGATIMEPKWLWVSRVLCDLCSALCVLVFCMYGSAV